MGKSKQEIQSELYSQIRRIAIHSYKKENEIPHIKNENQRVSEMYLFTQYIERKAFEMRLLIDDYIRDNHEAFTHFSSKFNDDNTDEEENSDNIKAYDPFHFSGDKMLGDNTRSNDDDPF